MGKCLLVSLLALASADAFASKARVLNLQGARFLRDPQTLFSNPAHINHLPAQVNAEFGDSSVTGDPKAEGGIFMEKLSGRMGLYLGHLDPIQKRIRDPESYYIEQNPLELVYGNGSWGASVFYSNNKDDTTLKGQKTFGLRAGHADDNFELYGSVDIIGENRADAAKKMKLIRPAFTLGTEYAFRDYYFFGEATVADSYQDITTPVVLARAEVDLRTYELGVQDRSFSSPARLVYYGLSFKYDQLKKNKTSIYNVTMPIAVGLEVPAADWILLRASVLQNFLLGYTQDQTLASPSNKRDTIANNTAASAGVSFRFKEFEVDGVAQGSTTGEFNGSNMLARLSLIYKL